MKPSGVAVLALALAGASPDRALGQTFQAAQAVHEVKCRSILGIFDKCATIETDRIHSTFTRNKLGNRYLFGQTWATASHCTRLDASEAKCKRSVLISTDPMWNRIIWGQSDAFLQAYGTGGTASQGPGHFLAPLGADISRREGEWHVGFIADSRNDRVVVIALGYSCKCVRWLGTLDGSESGTPLRNPHDVAWDPADSWSFADDRVFIADTDNHRVVVYRVNVNPAGGTMTKTYLNSFGTNGQGPTQFSGPQGITVRSWVVGTYVYADVYVADTDNGRVSLWYYDTPASGTPATPFAAAQSPPPPPGLGTVYRFVGITQDHYGDVIVADAADKGNRLFKFKRYGLTPLKGYGGAPDWASGNFNTPTDVDVIYHYWQDSFGNLIEEGLPYVQTVERWTATTGGQLHHLGVDAEQLGVSAGVCYAAFTFLFTAYGDYTVKVKNSAGTVVASWSRTGVGSGWKSEYWNGKDRPPGTYSYVIEHRNAYGDETQSRTSAGPSFSQNCFSVTANAPSQALQGGTYSLSGTGTHPADSWKWERNDGAGYFLWATSQTSSFHVPYDPGRSYTILWRVIARRSADGIWDSAGASTAVLDDCVKQTCPMSPAIVGQKAQIAGGGGTVERRPEPSDETHTLDPAPGSAGARRVGRG